MHLGVPRVQIVAAYRSIGVGYDNIYDQITCNESLKSRRSEHKGVELDITSIADDLNSLGTYIKKMV